MKWTSRVDLWIEVIVRISEIWIDSEIKEDQNCFMYYFRPKLSWNSVKIVSQISIEEFVKKE